MQTSKDLFNKAKTFIPGGVNSPVRAFSSVGADPIYMKSGHGAWMVSEEGDEYLDFCGSWGPLVLGHADPDVVKAVQEAVSKGLSFGSCCAAEVEMAELICSLSDGIDKVRMVNSGTEATMTALRLARGYTGRERVVKFAGCYHGHHDAMLVSAGSGLLTQGQASSEGVTPGTVASVSVLPYGDADAFSLFMKEKGDETAAVIIEPVAGNMGMVNPGKDYLLHLRKLCSSHGTVLIFDEVITGFRQGPFPYGNAVEVMADLTCLGKIIGGGMPIGAIGGRADILDCLSPEGAVYQAGTLSGNPVALAAGITTLKKLRDENPYGEMERLCSLMAEKVNTFAKREDLDFHIAHMGGQFTPFFRKEEIRSLEDAQHCDTEGFAAFHRYMLSRKIYLPPSQFETAFFSAVHCEQDALFLADAVIDFLEKL